jgi:hypothetical protein
MLGNYRVAAQLVASRVVLSSTELFNWWLRQQLAVPPLPHPPREHGSIQGIHGRAPVMQILRLTSIMSQILQTRLWSKAKEEVPWGPQSQVSRQRQAPAAASIEV